MTNRKNMKFSTNENKKNYHSMKIELEISEVSIIKRLIR